MTYTKLFKDILDSTIWRESNETRLVWITMLAMSDKYGDVHSSIPGLADRAKVSIEECEAALECLQSPDKYSRTSDFEGRRIEPIEGGWNLLNHGKYRQRMNQEERREYNRVKQAEYRARQKAKASKSVSNGEQMSAVSAHTDTDTDEKSIARSARSGILAHADAIYAAYPIKKGKKRAMAAIEKALRRGEDPEAILAAVQAFAQAHKRGGPAPHAGTYFNQERWADEDNGKVSKLIPDGKPGVVSRTVPKYESKQKSEEEIAAAVEANAAGVEELRRMREANAKAQTPDE